MVTNKTVKFFTSDNSNAPQLQNASGSLITLLDACLVTGIQVGVINSLSSTGLEATAVFGLPHNLKKYQVVRVSGATQAEYSGDFKIKQVVNATTIKFELNSVASVANASGTINCMLAPLNWDKPFSSSTALGGGRAAYRSKDETLPNRPFLRVVDERISSYGINYAKYAKVGIVEEMTGIDVMQGVQAPYIASATTRNWNPTGSGVNIKNGWAKWYYYTLGEYNVDSTSLVDYETENRSWMVIGTESAFYILNGVDNQKNISDEEKELAFCYGFGAFNPIADDDLFTHYLLASNAWEIAQGAQYRMGSYTRDVVLGSEDYANTTSGRSVFLQRGYKKSAYAQATCRKVTLEPGTNTVSGGSTSYVVNSDVFGGVVIQTPLVLEVTASSQAHPRGFLPLIKTIPHKAHYNNVQLIEEGDLVLLTKHVRGTNSIPLGVVLFDLGEQ
ncbi:hypothetical protein [Acinetobacter johnsonii]|uniref:hypothetical protein n=1 Tax=Acinetobacter johnsonii TaxID=40214 RepID=UPI002D800BAE|nr:hypothetical protein [Acinetobacter johnsonii]